MIETSLDIRSNAVDRLLDIAPLDRHLGGEDLEAAGGRLRIKIGERPIARNLRTLYEQSGRKIPPELQVFMEYEIWMVTVVVHVIRESGFKKVRQFGCRTEFPDHPRITILSLLPDTEFVKEIDGHVKIDANVKVTGDLSVPEITLKTGYVDVSSGVAVAASVDAGVAANISFEVLTPKIVTTGVGGRRSEFLFREHKHPLDGDHMMVHTLLTPKRTRELPLKVSVYATVSGFDLIPVRLESEWVNLSATLK